MAKAHARMAIIQKADSIYDALRMRQKGYTYQRIADELELPSSARAYDLVAQGLKSMLKEPAEELRALEVSRIDQLWEVVFALAIGGDLKAVDRCIRLSERRASLLGLDMPQEHLVVAAVEVKTVNQLEKMEPEQLRAFLGQLADLSRDIVDGKFEEE